MDLFHCGNQWGYTPMGRVSNIPGGYCNPPTNLAASVQNQYATLSWVAPHDYLYFELNYRKVGDIAWTSVIVYGVTYLATLDPLTEYEWRVRTHCEALRFSTWVNGSNFTTGKEILGCTAVSSVAVSLIFDETGRNYEATWAYTGASHYVIRIYLAGTDVVVFSASTSRSPYRIPAIFTHVDDCFEVTVTAVCFDGSIAAESPRSNPYCPGGECPVCRNITYTSSDDSIAIGWFAPAEFQDAAYTYNIYLDNELVASAYPDTIFTFTGLTAGTVYDISVRTNCKSSFSDVLTIQAATKQAPCNEPASVVVSAITATGAQLDWTPGAGVTSQELIINNGTPIALGAAVATYTITGMPSGSQLSARIRSICTGIPTKGVEKIINLSGCATVTGLALSVAPKGIIIAWNPIANADHYKLGIQKDGGGYEYQDVAVNEFLYVNPVKGSTYDVTVQAVCMVSGTLVEGTADTDSITIATDPYGNCSNYLITGVKHVDATTVGFNIGEDLNNDYGGPIRLVIYANGDTATPIDTKVVFTPGYYELTNLVVANDYDIYAYQIINPEYDPADPLLDGCTLHTPVDYQHNSCWAMTPANFDCSFAGTTLTFDLQATSFTGNQLALDLYYMTEEGLDWVFLDTLAIPGGYPYNIVSQPRTRYRFRVIVSCDGLPMDPVDSDWICPDTPDINYVVSGTTLSLSEAAADILNDDTVSYQVTLTSLSKGTFQTTVPRSNMVITGLYPNTVYTAEVKLICSDNPLVLKSAKTFTFITGNENQVICPPADFSSIIQNCAIEDPIDTGGEEEPPGGTIDCGLNSMSWQVINSLFIKDPDNDLSSKYYFETTIALNNSQPSGDVLMPGGVAAAIQNSLCYPSISSVMDVEIVSGATALVAASATLGDDGNLTITGTYTTNGASQLVLRVKGTYTF